MERINGLAGLTGQTGAGKTLVSSMLAGHGLRVIDADLVARSVVAKGSKCTLDLAVAFGIGILGADGTLNRKKLGDIVFADKQKRLMLNKIIFPYIQEEIFAQVEAMLREDPDVIFLDAPTLIESGTDKRCGRVVSVIAPLEQRLQRVIARDRISEEAALLRIRAQHDDEFYTSRSDFVIENNGDINDLRVKVLQLIDFVRPKGA